MDDETCLAPDSSSSVESQNDQPENWTAEDDIFNAVDDISNAEDDISNAVWEQVLLLLLLVELQMRNYLLPDFGFNMFGNVCLVGGIRKRHMHSAPSTQRFVLGD